MIRVNCVGRFSVIDVSNDVDITPKSRKAKAILAMLALASNKGGARSWVQRTLWSDRGQEQGSASLRGALTEIRKSFGAKQRVLVTKGDWLSLDATEVQVRLNTDPAVGEELLEALESIRDPVFLAWLKHERDKRKMELSLPTLPIGRGDNLSPTVVLDYAFNKNEHHDSVLSTMVNRITVALLEGDVLDVLDSNNLVAPAGELLASPAVQAKLRITHLGTKMHVFVTASDTSSNRVFHSDQVSLNPYAEWSKTCHLIEALCIRLVETMVRLAASQHDTSKGSRMTAGGLSRMAIGYIFDLDRDKMLKADELLLESYALKPSGGTQALRAFLRSLSRFQYPDDNDFKDDVPLEMLSMKALRDSPRDSTVLSVASQFEYLYNGNSRTSLNLAINAVEINPLNALSWAVLSNTQLSIGRFDEAHCSAKTARNLSLATSQQYYFEFFCCMSASAAGKFEEAIGHAELSLVLKPNFVAPRRYLVALYKKQRLTAKYDANLQSLVRFEPNFSVSRLGDPDYPVNTLRRISLIDSIL